MIYFIWIVMVLQGTSLLAEGRSLEGVAPQVQIPVELRFFKQAIVGADRIYVGDVAECLGGAKVCQQITSVHLGHSPRPGQKYQVLTSEITTVLNQEFPKLEILANEEKRVNVRAEGVKPLAEDVKIGLNRHLTEKDYFNEKRLVVQRVRLPYSFLLRPGKVSWSFPDTDQLVELCKKTLTRRTQQVSLLAIASTRHQGSLSQQSTQIYVQFAVEQFLPVLIEDVSARQTLREKDFEYRWIPYQHGGLYSLDQILGNKPRRNLRAGRSVKRTDFYTPYAVNRGQTIEVIIHQGSMRLKSKGRAMNHARVGESVTVALINSKKKVSAQVVSSKLAEVRP